MTATALLAFFLAIDAGLLVLATGALILAAFWFALIAPTELR